MPAERSSKEKVEIGREVVRTASTRENGGRCYPTYNFDLEKEIGVDEPSEEERISVLVDIGGAQFSSLPGAPEDLAEVSVPSDVSRYSVSDAAALILNTMIDKPRTFLNLQTGDEIFLLRKAFQDAVLYAQKEVCEHSKSEFHCRQNASGLFGSTIETASVVCLETMDRQEICVVQIQSVTRGRK